MREVVSKDRRSNIEIDPNKEYFLAGDISISMNQVDPRCGGNTRFNYMLESFQSFIAAAEDFDQHGAPTILLFGERVQMFEHAKYEEIRPKLENVRFESFTNIDLVIETVWRKHLEEKREARREGKTHPGSVLLVFTDGAPTNRAAVERSIVRIAGEVEREDEFQITFLTVGTIASDLADYLENLHENLERSSTKYDVFHVERLENTNFLAAATAVNH